MEIVKFGKKILEEFAKLLLSPKILLYGIAN